MFADNESKREPSSIPREYDSVRDAIRGALSLNGHSQNWLREQLGKGGSFHTTLKASRILALADECFRLLGITLVIREQTGNANIRATANAKAPAFGRKRHGGSARRRPMANRA